MDRVAKTMPWTQSQLVDAFSCGCAYTYQNGWTLCDWHRREFDRVMAESKDTRV